MRSARERVVELVGCAVAAVLGMVVLALQARRILAQLIGVEERDGEPGRLLVFFAITAGVVAAVVQHVQDVVEAERDDGRTIERQ